MRDSFSYRVLALGGLLAVGVSLWTYQAQAAFSAQANSSKLVIFQTVSNGEVTIDNLGTGNAFRATDGSGTTTFFNRASVEVRMLSNSNDKLNIQLDRPHASDVLVYAGDGARNIDFTGSNNIVGRHLEIHSGSGNQRVALTESGSLFVEGHLIANLGTGFDTLVGTHSAITVDDDLAMTNVNFFQHYGDVTVGGNVTSNSAGENDTNILGLYGLTSITGNFVFSGGPGPDGLELFGMLTIGGSTQINMGSNNAAVYQNIRLGEFARFTGAVTATSTSSSTDSLALDRFLDRGANFLAEVSVNLGDGSNEARFQGTYSGTTVQYQGGRHQDNVEIYANASNTRFNFRLDDGYDYPSLHNTAVLKSLSIDLGCPVGGKFSDYLGAAPFPISIQSPESGACDFCFPIKTRNARVAVICL